MPERQVRHQYDALAASYDRYWQTYLTRTLRFLQDWAQLRPQQRVLDVACGTGIFARLVLAIQAGVELVLSAFW